VLEPMDHQERWFQWHKSIVVKELLSGRHFQILYPVYEEFAAGGWIEGAEAFPFDQWVYPLSFHLTAMTVTHKGTGNLFRVGYGALMGAQGIVLQT
jgi:hypothetical protein